jgi:hypothetical protein
MTLADGRAVAQMRLTPGVRAAVAGDDLWLRGESVDDRVRAALRQLAPAEIYAVTPEALLVPAGRRLPVGRLPEGLSWFAIAQFFPLKAGQTALPGEVAGAWA